MSLVKVRVGWVCEGEEQGGETVGVGMVGPFMLRANGDRGRAGVGGGLCPDRGVLCGGGRRLL